MNTLQLECFMQVAANLNFRRAAEELHLSQPTVSKQIAALEDEVGGALFVRSTRSVALTALGESFLADAGEILRLMYASAERARTMSSGNLLAIGYSDPNDLQRIAPILRSIHKDRGGLSITLRLAPRDVNVDQLSRGRIDVALGFENTALETGNIGFTLLCEDGLACIVPRTSPLATLNRIDAGRVKGLPQIVCLPISLRRQGYAAQGSIPASEESLTTRCQTTSEAVCLVDAGFGYALIPSVQANDSPQHVCIPWEGSPHARYGAYHRREDREPAVDAFLELARDAYARDR